ncbi:hypothetical protein QYH69_31350 [Paraburkholderia sp. SARCC-3016]|nr:hypothetical protein [Paraburkholderia sp. SARCC-3016]MDQ7981723.1 hypothetical protein [Paraburkholderia sp. SARCC-3016]
MRPNDHAASADTGTPSGCGVRRMIDDFNREALGIEIDLSLPSARVMRALEQIIGWRGKPMLIRRNNGTEGVRSRMGNDTGIILNYSQPSKLRQNAYMGAIQQDGAL